MERVLDESATGVIAANGKVTVTLGPKYYGEWWDISTIAVSTSTTVLTPSVHVYRGPATPNNLIAATYDGAGDSTDTSVRLNSNEKLTAQWGLINLGDVGATATVSVYGVQGGV